MNEINNMVLITICSGDLLFVAEGCKSAVDGLKLDAAGTNTDEKGFIVVDDALITPAEGVWAVGDCKGGFAFTQITDDDDRVLNHLWFGAASSIPRTGIAGRPVPQHSVCLW